VTSNAETERLGALRIAGRRVQRAARTIFKALRNDADYTREQMAAVLGVSAERVKNWELGHRAIRLDDIVMVALGLNKDPERVVLQILRWTEVVRPRRRQR
jgi:transcriptional regulator with XRE-family HTH domain